MKFVKYILMIVILSTLSVMQAQTLNELSIPGKAIKPQGEIVPQDMLDANKNQAALISFITDLDVDMDFRPWNGAVKITNPAMGRWNVYVSPQERAIDVHAEGFKPLKVVLASYGIAKLNSGDIYHLELTGQKKVDSIPVIITTDPSLVNIFIDDESAGISEKGELNLSLPQGTHAIRLEKDGFETLTQQIDVQIGTQRFDYYLDEKMNPAITIKSIPPGATVHIGEHKFGVTPVTNFYREGTFPIKIELENYDTINEMITITEDAEFSYKLEDIRARLTINTYPNATVYINDNQGSRGGVKDLLLSPQPVNIRIEMPKAETINTSIILDKKAVVVKDFFPELQTGIIMVNVIPADAYITLSGDGGEKFQSTGKNTFRDVPIGSYTLNITAPGYQSVTQIINLKADDTIRKEIVLRKYTAEAEKPAPKKDSSPTFSGRAKSSPSFSGKAASSPSKGYFGGFLNIGLNSYLYSQNEEIYNQSNYEQVSYLNGIYRTMVNDDLQVAAKAQYAMDIFIAQADVTYYDYYEYNYLYTSNESIINIDLEGIYEIVKPLNCYLSTSFISSHFIEKEYLDGVEESSNDSPTFLRWDYKTGFCIEGEKGIHLLTPGYDYQKGMFAELLYRGYLLRTYDGESYEDDPSWLVANFRYHFLTGNNYMIVPACYNAYDFRSEVLNSITSISAACDFSAEFKAECDIYWGYRFYDGAQTSITSVIDAKLHYLLNYYTIDLDFYLGYNLLNTVSGYPYLDFGEYDDRSMFTYGIQVTLGN
ncbi:MAG: PEGA domain-containing protein [Candidatus Cloacimonetes bacterium]|nr:PEGA domain-containing protein [Candidatus Cloacimonadota bacterium]